MATELLHLPQELRIQILSNLDAVSLTRCAMTCKFMYDTLRSSSQLQYILQLHFGGLKDTGTSATHSELIARLLHHRQAWQALAWRGYDVVDMEEDCQAYELVGGAFANADRQHFEIVWLPTSSNVEGRTLRRTCAGMLIRDFAMDPTQDIIALLEDDTTPPFPTTAHTIRIHIRTISTDGHHPLARHSTLELVVYPDPGYGYALHNVDLELADNTLVLYFCTPAQVQPRVHIWDWTTSEVLLDSLTSFDPWLSSLRYDFGLLDCAYCFVICPANSGSIRLYKLVRSPSITRKPIHLATLHLPPTTLETEIFRMSAHTGPIEVNPLPHTPFMINDDDRIHVFSALYIHKGNGITHAMSRSFNLFVHQHVFKKYCMKRANPDDPPLDVPWSEWGPPNTRLITPACTQIQWLRYVHGQRVICPIYSSTRRHIPTPTSWVQVFDFSRAAVLSAKEKSDHRRTLSTSSGVIHAHYLPFFQDDVETHLPFVSMTVKFEQEYSAYMIYGDGLVGVTNEDDGSLLLHVYPVLQEPIPSEILIG